MHAVVFLLPLVLGAEPTVSNNTNVYEPMLLRAMDRSGAFTRTTTLADGTVQLDLNGGGQEVVFARLGPDGTVEQYCTHNPADADRWINHRHHEAPTPQTMTLPAEQER